MEFASRHARGCSLLEYHLLLWHTVRTLGSEDASFDLKVISKSFLNEIDGIVVAGFEIDMVDVVPPCPINDPADASPQACHCAHSARPECAVIRVAL